jgi:hypothetical protein
MRKWKINLSITQAGTDLSLTLPYQLQLPNKKFKFSVTKFNNNKKITHEITVMQHEQHVAEVTAELKQDKKRNPNLMDRSVKQNCNCTGEQVHMHVAK